MQIQSLGGEDPLEEGTATHSSILARRIPVDRGAWGITVHVLCLVSQSCPTLCNLMDPMDYSPPGSSVHGILQARILEWVAMPSTRGSSQARDQAQVSCIGGVFFTV